MQATAAPKSEEKKKSASPRAETPLAVEPMLEETPASVDLPFFLRRGIQRKSAAGEADDPGDHAAGSSPNILIQRACSCGGSCSSCQDRKEEELVQRQLSPGTDGGVADSAIIPAESTGHPLDDSTRMFMESRFGSDFSGVRVHTDSDAAQSAHALSADAYTAGQDIYFASGKYAPDSQEGQHLIAHELTHTVQQQDGATPIAASRAGGVLVGTATDPLEAEAEHTADTVVGTGSKAPQGSNISRDGAPAVRRGIASDVWDATGGRVVRAAEWVWDEAKEAAAAFIDRIAPGLLPLLRNASGLLYEKITSGMDAAFNGIVSRVKKQGLAGAISGILTDMAGSIGKTLGQLALGACHSIVEAAGAIIHFAKSIAGQAFAELGKIAKEVGDFFSRIWHDYGAPALEAIEKVAGAAWKWIKEKATWIWDKLLPIRNAFSKAWNWIKKEFNLAKEEASGVLGWLYDKAKEQWMKIRDKIAPILGPLKIVAGVLLLFSPLGPIIVLWKGLPLLWQGLQWIWAHGLKPIGEKIRAEFREHVLPLILQGIDAATAKLDEASNFLCGHASTISSNLRSLQEALGAVPFMGLAARAVGVVADFFDNLAAKGKCKFSDVIAEAKSVLRRIHQFLKPVLEALRQAVLIAEFGPLALIDDGVWHTFTSFIAFVKKTPCLREMAGLFGIDPVVAKITEIRTELKDIYEVITNQDRFEAAIHSALDGLLAAIPGQVEGVLGKVAGLDGPHLNALMRRFIAPKLAKTIAGAPKLLIDMVWGLVWPWPGVMKEWDEIQKQGGKFKQSLWDFEFSKAIDAGLAIWRGVNGIIGQLYGWFFLAAVLIGAVFGAPQAGAAVAYEVGEALLASTLIAEGMTIEKAKFNLMSSSRAAEPEKDREAHDDEDYETLSGSVMNLAVMGALAVLSEIAVDFAKAIFAEIKGVFNPRGVEAPAEVPVEAPKTGEPVKPGEAPKPADASKPVPEDVLTDAEKKGVPREQLEPEIRDLRQKAGDPANVHQPADPAFDAEMDAEGHTFDREKAGKSWCRHSETACGLNLGDDLNAKVDDALKQKPKPEDELPKEDPAEPAKKPAGKETEEPTETSEQTSRKERAREEIEQKLEKLQEQKKANQAEIERLRKEISEANQKIESLKEKVKNSSGEARKQAVQELKEAREAKAELMDEQSAYYDDQAKLKETEDALEKALLEDTYSRPPLRKEVKQKIQDAAKKTPDGKFIDPNTGKPIEGDFHYGHKPGHEQRRLALEAQAKGMTRQQFIDWVNDHPEWFQIEDPSSNVSHKYEKPGVD